LTEAHARGIAVPKQLAVMGFGDFDFSAHLHPALTTVRVDGTAIGHLAAQFILQRTQGIAIEQTAIDIGFSIIDRGSV
jgi:LacI family gluconate utilization system Gnt-I transcriptional repressor